MTTIKLLPKVLQDLIGEFNVEHRPNMRLVLDELHTSRMCMFCDATICNELYKKNVTIHRNISKKIICCSQNCLDMVEICLYEFDEEFREQFRFDFSYR